MVAQRGSEEKRRRDLQIPPPRRAFAAGWPAAQVVAGTGLTGANPCHVGRISHGGAGTSPAPWAAAAGLPWRSPIATVEPATIELPPAARPEPGPRPPAVALPGSALPLPLRAIPDPPARLFCQGDPAVLANPAVAIVGSRRCTRQGRELAFALARDLATQGLTVVSGLAYGIDAAAHGGALAASAEPERPPGQGPRGVTVAVLGSGLDRVYPRSHAALAAKIIAAGGALVSEYEPGEGPRRHHFPARNRIISGLCLGVVIVEASTRSGSLITARMALEQGRDVMAVPSLVSNPVAAGCHRLIRQGAALVERAEHVMEALGLEWTDATVPVASVSGTGAVVLAEVNAVVTPLEAIVAGSGLAVEDVLQCLIELEINGLVAAHGGGYIRKAT